MADDRQSWRKTFEAIGPAQLRLRLEHRRAQFSHEYAQEAKVWLLEKDVENAAIELKRFQIVRRWTIIAGVAGIVAAIAGLIAAWPVIKDWFR